MIILGSKNKADTIEAYIKQHGIKRVVVISHSKFEIIVNTDVPCEVVTYEDCIQYVYYYRLLQEIDSNTLLVINECMRSQKRNGELTFNVIRVFLQNTKHKIVFQYLPQIDTFQDFAVLFDWDTDSRYKKTAFSEELLIHAEIVIDTEVCFSFTPIAIPTSPATLKKYEQEKEKLIAGIGIKDPHTIPRNLHLLGAKDKILYINNTSHYLMRSNKYKLKNMRSYKEGNYSDNHYIIFEWCHNYIDFIDFAYLSEQIEFQVMTTEIKVDKYYLDRYTEWAERISKTYSILKRYAKTNIQ